MADFKCNGNCLGCQPAQRAYCASQHAYSNMKVLDTMMGIVLAMQGDLKNLSEKIEAIQNNEASVFDPNQSNQFNVLDGNHPTEEVVTEKEFVNAIAQSGDGAVK